MVWVSTRKVGSRYLGLVNISKIISKVPGPSERKKKLEAQTGGLSVYKSL